MRVRLLAAFLLLLAPAAPAAAQQVPALTGRVVDQADLLPPDREAALTQRLETLERETSRQLVVVTVPDLQGHTVEDFGYRLGSEWKLGNEQADNGAILLIAVRDRRMRIEVGDGLEPILTDAMSGLIIRERITPRFRDGDYAGGIEAGVDAIMEQLRAPPEVAEQRALEAAERERQGGDESWIPLIFWLFVLGFILLSLMRRGFGGRRYRGRRRRRGGPIVIWGPTAGGGWGSGSSGSSGWSGGWGSSGGGWGGGGGGGGFSGGGGSFGGGGASGGW